MVIPPRWLWREHIIDYLLIPSFRTYQC
jgi:hypothetical protein